MFNGRAKIKDAFSSLFTYYRGRLGKSIFGVKPNNIFVGSPHLEFTFGLEGPFIFPLNLRATATLLEQSKNPDMLEIIEKYRATILIIAPTSHEAEVIYLDENETRNSKIGRLALRGPIRYRYLKRKKSKINK